ncbi:MAG: hypothetical protein ABIQ27_04855 [Flavobacterium sp.]|uniref:hypothetical protein n=1 Tax=Flavobacterium sp. TaxID=239 RepID=UPI003263C184
MKNVKMFSMVVLFTIAGSLANAQQKPKAAKLKKHVCTEACHKAGKCVLAHGEKGHKCDANCKKM